MPTQQNWAELGQGFLRGESASQWEAVQRLTEGATIQERGGKGTPGGGAEEGSEKGLLAFRCYHSAAPFGVPGSEGLQQVGSYHHVAVT